MDLGLTEEQQAIQALFTDFFTKESPPERVRAAEPLGFDPGLWRRIGETGACEMGLPPEQGGTGASVLDAALVAEALGEALAPIPFIEHFVASRLLARAGASLKGLEGDARIATLALHPAVGTTAQLVPAGAVAHDVVAWVDGSLVHVCEEPSGTAPANLAGLPLSDRDLTGGTPLAEGEEAQRLYGIALDEWRALTASALVGLAQRAFEIGLAYTQEREQFGRKIGSFQALQHGLADVAVQLDGARLLAQKAAWAFEDAPDDASRLAGMALLFSGEVASLAARRSLHYHGGVGFSLEYDIQLYYRRAKGWRLVHDDPGREIERLGVLLFGAREEGA